MSLRSMTALLRYASGQRLLAWGFLLVLYNHSSKYVMLSYKHGRDRWTDEHHLRLILSTMVADMTKQCMRACKLKSNTLQTFVLKASRSDSASTCPFVCAIFRSNLTASFVLPFANSQRGVSGTSLQRKKQEAQLSPRDRAMRRVN